MTDTTERVATGRSGLATMNVVELKRLASGLGITGTTKMRKDDLVAAITARQVGSAPRSEAAAQPQRQTTPERDAQPAASGERPAAEQRSEQGTADASATADRVDGESRRSAPDRTRATADTTPNTTGDQLRAHVGHDR